MPDVARWNRPDPLGRAGGDPDVYGYCIDDPINITDKSGLKTTKSYIGLEGAMCGVGLGVEAGYAKDDKGDKAITVGGKIEATSDVGANIILGKEESNATRVRDLNGSGKYVGTRIGPFGHSYEKSNGYESNSTEIGLNIGKDFGIPTAVSTGIDGTLVIPIPNF